jgi:hypothetical protein
MMDRIEELKKRVLEYNRYADEQGSTFKDSAMYAIAGACSEVALAIWKTYQQTIRKEYQQETEQSEKVDRQKPLTAEEFIQKEMMFQFRVRNFKPIVEYIEVKIDKDIKAVVADITFTKGSQPQSLSHQQPVNISGAYNNDYLSMLGGHIVDIIERNMRQQHEDQKDRSFPDPDPGIDESSLGGKPLTAHERKV